MWFVGADQRFAVGVCTILMDQSSRSQTTRSPRSKYREVPALRRREAERQSLAFKPHEPPRRSRNAFSSSAEFCGARVARFRRLLAVLHTTPKRFRACRTVPTGWAACDRLGAIGCHCFPHTSPLHPAPLCPRRCSRPSWCRRGRHTPIPPRLAGDTAFSPSRSGVDKTQRLRAK